MVGRPYFLSIDSAIRALLFLLATAIVPAAAHACIIPPRPVLAFWETKPDAEPGEVVVQLRLLRVENPSPRHVVTICGEPSLFVYEVVTVAAGAFAPAQVYLYGSGAPLNGDTGWLVGQRRTLFMKHILWLKDGDPPAPEYPSIEWRPPECVEGFVCRPPDPELFKP